MQIEVGSKITLSAHPDPCSGGLRDYEVYRFNNTIISTGDAKVFKYFWKIENFTKRLQAAPVGMGATFSSAVFVISGLNLRLHARTVERKADGDLLYVQLEQLSAWDDELRKTPNVILASGAMYGQMETKKFFRHKIIILNQVSEAIGHKRLFITRTYCL